MKCKLIYQRVDVANVLIKKYFSYENILDITKKKLDQFSELYHLVIIEPYKVQNIYFTISPIWKRHLAIHLPETKLIVMGFCNFQSRNYIDLLNLPKDFNAYVKNALTVSEDWEIPIDGADMQEYLKRFFEGHGTQSLISKLNRLQTTFNSAETLIKTGEATFQEVQNELLIPFGKSEWDGLIKRWKNYYPYFEYLPFYPQIEEIDKILKEISEFFTCKENKLDLFLKLNGSKKLKKITKDLLEIDRLYIRPEKYQR